MHQHTNKSHAGLNSRIYLLQRLREVPVVERHGGGDPVGEQLVGQVLIKLFLVFCGGVGVFVWSGSIIIMSFRVFWGGGADTFTCLQPLLVDRARAVGHDAGPGDGVAVRLEAQLLHQLHVLLVAVESVCFCVRARVCVYVFG